MKTLKIPKGHPYEKGRTCTTCQTFKTQDNFTLERDSRCFGGISMRSKCKPCNELRKYKTFIQRTYGISYEEYVRLEEAQSNSCAICKSPESLNKRTSGKLFVDHCHATGKVRGLLCSKCNHGLGHFNDDVNLLNLAISYLTQKEP
jgi:hypothetical protein